MDEHCKPFAIQRDKVRLYSQCHFIVGEKSILSPICTVIVTNCALLAGDRTYCWDTMGAENFDVGYVDCTPHF